MDYQNYKAKRKYGSSDRKFRGDSAKVAKPASTEAQAPLKKNGKAKVEKKKAEVKAKIKKGAHALGDAIEKVGTKIGRIAD